MQTLYRFKKSVADFYFEKQKELVSSLVVGPKLYIDETVVSLQSKNGYVWCITDGASVYYFYRDSREAAFLLHMLKDFKGVLISDFFTGYDAVPCPQQRCLIHLMRDFNEEMQKNPFDDELKILAQRFSSALRAIVATVDKVGYQKKHLRKHKQSASDFCKWASCRQFVSVAAERLRNRVEKYQDKMFKFLDYDGVCWNNTNAEHAIKAFARYRRTADGRFTERSIQEYLAVLSIAETCKGRGEDFLEFLLKDDGCPVSFRPRTGPSAEAGGPPASIVATVRQEDDGPFGAVPH
jgi:hypothetical protein